MSLSPRRLEVQAIYRERHREEIRRKAKEYRQANLEADRLHKRKYYLKRTHGISMEHHETLFKLQGEVCAICKSNDPIDKQWNTDHCHATGRIRGVLCGNCNRGLGLFKDDPERLYAAVQYLKRTPENI